KELLKEAEHINSDSYLLGTLLSSGAELELEARVYYVNAAQEVRIPHELLEYADVFDNRNAEILLQYKSLDYAIPIVEGKEPPYGPLYTLSLRELQLLREYIEEALRRG
ncbi:hypothetical protein AA0111_g12895, partial [Alternaria arborescens]|uniref:hypothetical protein n=1 Tax=Alternaria arborescens TaxID=156630 RepID=UPI0010750A6C